MTEEEKVNSITPAPWKPVRVREVDALHHKMLGSDAQLPDLAEEREEISFFKSEDIAKHQHWPELEALLKEYEENDEDPVSGTPRTAGELVFECWRHARAASVMGGDQLPKVKEEIIGQIKNLTRCMDDAHNREMGRLGALMDDLVRRRRVASRHNPFKTNRKRILAICK